MIFKRRAAVLVLLASCLAARAPAEVVETADNGFAIRVAITVPADPPAAYAALVSDVGKWWDSEHTYSGDAANLSIDAKPQGCFCERLPSGGGVRHMTVVFAAPGKTLRLEGGLGPLQAMPVAGTMTWSFRATEKGTTVDFRYAVGGYVPGGTKELAAGVDSVLRAQLERYRAYVASKKPS